MQSREFYINDDGIRLHAKLDFPAEEKEKYPLLIIIHGFTGHMEEPHIVAAAQTAVEEGYAALRVEMYGHGGSDGLFRDHTLYKWLANTLAVIDYAKGLGCISGLYLCGHSQGGLDVMLAGAMEQDKVEAIIPMSPAIVIPEGARNGNLLGQPFDPDNIPEIVCVTHIGPLGGNYARVAQTIRVEDAIDRFVKPVLLIHGDADESVPVDYSVMAAERYADARLVLIQGDTHCYDYHMDEMVSALRDFLREMQEKK